MYKLVISCAEAEQYRFRIVPLPRIPRQSGDCAVAKFPFSMENIPRQTSFGCLSLKFGTILSALLCILYSILALAQCLAALSWSPSDSKVEDHMMTYGLIITIAIVHSVTLFLSAIMLVGALREDYRLMKPWVIWTSLHLMGCLLLFVFFTTINMINNFSDSSLLIYVTEFLSLIIRFYMLILVASYYKQLEEERDERIKSLISKDNWHQYA